MSTISKRAIWVGAVDGANQKPLNVEGKAVAAILPGTILSSSASGLDASAVAATVFGELPMVADKDQMRSRSVDVAWTINENMVGIQPRSGEFMNILVVTAQALVAKKTALSRNGAGLLKVAATGGTEEIVAYSDETLTTSGTELIRVRIK